MEAQVIGFDYRPKDGGVARLLKRQGHQPAWVILSWKQIEIAAYIIWALFCLWFAGGIRLGQ